MAEIKKDLKKRKSVENAGRDGDEDTGGKEPGMRTPSA
jgi:hypothetical protein